MKILSIRLKNLASIEGYFEIDFTAEPLSSAGIFAISGSTGAGKSTILDALCLALYDKTPRFAASGESLYLKDVGENQVNQSDVKNILRRGTGEGFAEVVFLGVDGHRYLSRWMVRRARSKSTGSLQAQTMQVQDFDTDKELQGTKTEILSQLVVLIGLTYEQFTRTVLLAQNDFATFLKSRESAKAELLEKLTGTEIYSQISRTIYARSKTASEAYMQLKNSLNLIELLPQEEIRQLQQEKAECVEQRGQAIKQLAFLHEKLKTITSLQTKRDLLTLKRKQEEAEIVNLNKLRLQLAQQAEQFTSFKKQCEALQPELVKAREQDIQIRTIQSGYMQAEQLYIVSRKRREELGKALSGKESALLLELAKLPTDHIRAKESSSEDAVKQAELHLIQYTERLETELKISDEQVLNLNAYNIRSLGDEQTWLGQEQKRLQKARQQVADWLKVQKESERLTNDLSILRTNLEKSEKDWQAIKIVLAAKEVQLECMQRLYDNARLAVGNNMETIREHLVPGEPCPVCGAKEHPYAREHTEIINSLYHSTEKEYKMIAEEHQQQNNKSIALERDCEHLKKQQSLLMIQFEAIRKEVEQKTPVREEERNVEHFDSALELLQQQLDGLSKRLREYQLLYEEWQKHDREIKKIRAYCESLKEIISSCRLLLQQVSSGTEQLAMATAAEADEQIRFKEISDRLEALRKNRSELLKGKTVEDAEAAIQRREKELNDWVEASRKEVDQQSTFISGMQGEIRQLISGIEELAAENEQMETAQELQDAIEVQQTTQNEIERRLSLVEARLLQQEQNRLKVNYLEVELKTKQQVAEQWEKLNKLIGSADGTKFKVIAQSYTLNLLLLHANKHLSYLSKRYKLQQVPDTLALQVIDCDMCDEIRTVYSLSGGESFLISLALALGLSSLSSNNLKVESLFIDEGFGSLDAESLRTAMEALEQLQMQGRKIGVISHIQEMSERIPVQVHVRKSVNGRSTIELVS